MSVYLPPFLALLTLVPGMALATESNQDTLPPITVVGKTQTLAELQAQSVCRSFERLGLAPTDPAQQPEPQEPRK